MKTLMIMMMMVLAQMASAHEVTSTWESTWELTLVTPDEMIDMPQKHHSYDSCVAHGIETMIHRKTTRDVLLGFVCEQEESDELVS